MASTEGPDTGSDKNVIPLFEDGGMEEGFEEAAEQVNNYSEAIAKASVASIGTLDAIHHEELTLKGRAKRISQEKLNRFPEVKVVRDGAGFREVVASSDENRYTAFRLLYGTGPDAPHFDEFSSRVKDGRGVAIDNNYDVEELISSLRIIGLESQSKRTIIECLYDWGRRRRQNDMQLAMERRTPEWDGVKRMGGSLINLFHCDDTPLTRMASAYFWLSFYARIFHPGCTAPVVICLIGTQNAGKSYFSKIICEEVMDDPHAAPIQMPLNKPMVNFLREITGQSVVANIGEMIGFGTADTEESKMRITTTTDTFDYKYEGSVSHARQWVIVMDGNKYEGMQRDDTGNRRFYPVFLGQLPDKNGKPHWKKVFSVDYSTFREDMWLYIAEAKAWIEENGFPEYIRFASELSNEVFKFSDNEMKMDRGTIRDQQVDNHLMDVLLIAERKWLVGRGTNADMKGVFYGSGEIGARYSEITGQRTPPYKKIKSKMESLGFEYITIGKGRTGFVYQGVDDLSDFRTKFFGEDDGDYDGKGEFTKTEGKSYMEEKGGGF